MSPANRMQTGGATFRVADDNTVMCIECIDLERKGASIQVEGWTSNVDIATDEYLLFCK